MLPFKAQPPPIPLLFKQHRWLTFGDSKTSPFTVISHCHTHLAQKLHTWLKKGQVSWLHALRFTASATWKRRYQGKDSEQQGPCSLAKQDEPCTG